MAQSIKFKDDIYIDSSGVTHNKTSLDKILTYSTTETKIGTWIDGKPLYRICKETTKSQVSSFLISLKIDRLISTVGSYATAIYSNSWPIPCYYVPEQGYDIGIMGGSTPGKQVSISFGSYYNDSSQVVLVLEYTKTTD